MKNINIIGLLLLVISLTLSAQTIKDYIRNDWPDNRYTVHGDGTVTDNKTNLMWKVCSEGQTWSSPATCSGTATRHNWQQALELADSAIYPLISGFNDWRLPNIAELRSLVAKDRSYPTINLTVFPNTPTNYFWSSSPNASSSDDARIVYFYEGRGGYSLRYATGRVRLVRAGQ